MFGSKGLTLQKPWSKSFQPTNHAWSFLSACSTGGREKTWVVDPETAWQFSAALYRTETLKFQTSKKKWFKKIHLRTSEVTSFFAFGRVSSSSIKELIGKKNAPPMRLAKIQQPHPSQQPGIVAHAQQGGEFGRAEKSHCYSDLKKPKVSPHLLMVSWDYVSVSSSGWIWKNVFFSTNFLQHRVILKSSPYLFCWVKGPYWMKLSILSGQTHNMSLLAVLMCSHTTGWLPKTLLTRPFSIIS